MSLSRSQDPHAPLEQRPLDANLAGLDWRAERLANSHYHLFPKSRLSLFSFFIFVIVSSFFVFARGALRVRFVEA